MGGIDVKSRTLRSRRNAVGWIFILPWLIGLLFFFVQPMITFLQYSLTDFTFIDGGYVLRALVGGPFALYQQALTADVKYPQLIVAAFRDLLYQTPVVVFFSLFVAVILNQKFRGRVVMRAIFFLPIIVTSGVIASIIRKDLNSITMAPAGDAANLFDVSMLTSFMLESGLPEQIVTALTTVIANVADLVWKSGIQILIFIAALLAVPPAYYEVAQVEGATGWETFWKVTFPIVSPFVLANTVYTIIDSFTNYGNGVIEYITEYAVKDMNYSYAAAMSWTYFLLILIVLGLVFLLFRRSVFYGNKREKAEH